MKTYMYTRRPGDSNVNVVLRRMRHDGTYTDKAECFQLLDCTQICAYMKFNQHSLPLLLASVSRLHVPDMD